jgi:hypothetical protein
LQVATGNTSETCVFCHTPHGSDTNAAGRCRWPV